VTGIACNSFSLAFSHDDTKGSTIASSHFKTMDDFAQEMACVVRRLFPDDDKENMPPIDEQNRRHKQQPTWAWESSNSMMHLHDKNVNVNKRKRDSVLATSRSFPLNEVRNGAIIKTKNINNTATTNQLYRSKGGVVTIKVDTLSQEVCVPIVNSSPKQNFKLSDESKVKISEEVPLIETVSVHNPNEAGCSSPAKDFMEQFDYVLSKRYPKGTDFLIIRDVFSPSIDDHGGVVPMEINLDELSKEQLSTIRVLIIPLQRQETMDEMGKLILGDRFGRNNIRYDRNFWFSILKSYGIFKRFYAIKSSDMEARFNLLFGFTYHLSKHPHWMNHHARGWGGEKMVSGLASRWKQLLKCLPGQMGLDSEFSYPAVLCFLQEFKTTVENVNTNGDPKLQFNYEK
jgi:hypothetical protein